MKANSVVRPMLVLLTMVLLCLAATCCGHTMTDEEKASWEAVSALMDVLKPPPFSGPRVYSTSDMEGGVSIVTYKVPVDKAQQIETYYAFWVHDKKVYSVNSAASKRYPELPESPSTINLDTVLFKASLEGNVTFKP